MAGAREASFREISYSTPISPQRNQTLLAPQSSDPSRLRAAGLGCVD